MAWVESRSATFSVRHEEVDAHHVEDLLLDLEAFRGELGELFERLPEDVSVIVHSRSAALDLAQPWLPLARIAAAPAARPYMAGWFSSRELHVLSPAALERRASGVPGSREALLLSPLHEYAHLVVGANNPALPPPFTPASFVRHLRWAWLVEGAATHLAGQTRHLRAASARRLREAAAPAFPPSPRDAPLLGCTLMALLERERGRSATAQLARRLDPRGPLAAVEGAFGRPARAVERDWRTLLDSVAADGTGERAAAGRMRRR